MILCNKDIYKFIKKKIQSLFFFFQLIYANELYCILIGCPVLPCYSKSNPRLNIPYNFSKKVRFSMMWALKPFQCLCKCLNKGLKNKSPVYIGKTGLSLHANESLID